MIGDRLAPRITSGRDPLTPEQRSRNMSRVRGKNTKPELLIRKALHATGLRYRLHGPSLPGRPDLVFPGPRAVIFVHGCFWHGHDCPLFRLPATRTEFWTKKIATNRTRDAVIGEELRARGWRALTIWECAIRGSGRRAMEDIVVETRGFILGGEEASEIRGR